MPSDRRGPTIKINVRKVGAGPSVQSPPRTTVDIPQRMVRRLEPNIGNTRDARRVSVAREILSRNDTLWAGLPESQPTPPIVGESSTNHTHRDTRPLIRIIIV
jgi:hypothetical protein